MTKHNYLTWAILKGHTQNRAGEAVLRSTDPLDTPLINFHYFDEGAILQAKISTRLSRASALSVSSPLS